MGVLPGFSGPGASTAFPGVDVRNDCEPLVRSLYPEVARALDWLSLRAPARLTGTGGCVFAVFAEQAQAARVAAEVPAPWQAFVAQGLGHSPVLDLLP
jgi:4-diphosphocytidyl-2-C-methyl-D-erythritol kinase